MNGNRKLFSLKNETTDGDNDLCNVFVVPVKQHHVCWQTEIEIDLVQEVHILSNECERRSARKKSRKHWITGVESQNTSSQATSDSNGFALETQKNLLRLLTHQHRQHANEQSHDDSLQS